MEQATDTHTDDTHEIFNRCSRGDRSAFRTVVNMYQQYAFSLAFRILCNEEDAKDIVQETFVRLWKNIHRYDHTIKFTTWMYTIVSNLCYDSLRSRKRQIHVLSDSIDSIFVETMAGRGDPGQILTNKELGDMITLLAERLPPRQRIVFILRDVQGLSVREVSDILDMNENSVKTNLVYARRAIRVKLEQYMKR